MLGIQNYPQYQVQARPSFKSSAAFDTSEITADTDEKARSFQEDQDALNDFADKLENSDSKMAKKASGLVKKVAVAAGAVATFFVAKGSAKVAMNMLKNVMNKGPVQEIVSGSKSALAGVVDKAKTFLGGGKVQKLVDKLSSTGLGKKVAGLLKGEGVQSILSSVKNINFEKVQKVVANIFGGTAVASYIVDDLSKKADAKAEAQNDSAEVSEENPDEYSEAA